MRTVEWRGRTLRTAIWKRPVGGPVHVQGVNLAGDDQADRRVHGGDLKAIYAYAQEDYEHWRAVEQVDVEPGLFGENLTVEGLDLAGAVVGERWEIGSVLLEVTQPRLPCVKLGVRMDDARFPKRFLEVWRLGAYLRIVRAGELCAGAPIHVVSRPVDGETLSDVAERLID